MIQDALKKLGFSEKESSIYLTVLENGKISPANIASITGIKRPTVYSVGKELMKKGVITEDLQGASSYFVALPPESLAQALEKQEREIAEKKKAVKGLIEELENVPRSKSYSVPKMRFIDEYGIKDFLYKQTPIWEKSMISTNCTTWWGFQDHTFVENKDCGEWISWYWGRAPKEIDLRLISNDSEIEKEMKEKKLDRRMIKFWSKDVSFSATTWVLGDYVILLMSRQKPNYIVEIHDSVYAENLRQVFKNLWPMIG